MNGCPKQQPLICPKEGKRITLKDQFDRDTELLLLSEEVNQQNGFVVETMVTKAKNVC